MCVHIIIAHRKETSKLKVKSTLLHLPHTVPAKNELELKTLTTLRYIQVATYAHTTTKMCRIRDAWEHTKKTESIHFSIPCTTSKTLGQHVYIHTQNSHVQLVCLLQ